MSDKLSELNARENELYIQYRGHIPEANETLNNLQREKISALYERNGKAFIGKINHYGGERELLTADVVFVQFFGQQVYNFEADFIVPFADRELAEMIVRWNAGGLPASLELISKITNRIHEIGGVSLRWS
jgi:hypothetical protein